MSHSLDHAKCKPLLGLSLAAFITACFGFSAGSLAKRPPCSQDNLKMRAKTKKQLVYHARQARRYGAPIKKSTVRLLGGVKVLPQCRKASPGCLRKAKSHLGHVKALQGLLQRLRRACLTKEQIAQQKRRRRTTLSLTRRGVLSLLGGGSGIGGGFGRYGRVGGGGGGGGLSGLRGLGSGGGGGGSGGSGLGGLRGFGRGGGGGGISGGSIGRGRRAGSRGTLGRGRVTLLRGQINNAALRQRVRRRMRSLRNFFKYCYHRALRKDPNLKARIKLSFSIGNVGRVRQISMTNRVSRTASFRRCIERKLRITRFPKSTKKNTKVSYTLLLSPR